MLSNSTSADSSTLYVVSDMHIFGCNSLYERYLPIFFRGVEASSITVLNGDTFDFRRSCYKDSKETASYAIDWLTNLAQRNGTKRFFYILGNHDSQRIFVEYLKQALSNMPNVDLIENGLILGSALFLHGDLTDLPDDSRDLSKVRAGYQSAEPNVSSKLFAQVVTYTRLNKLEHLRHPKRRLAQKIHRYLAISANEKLQGISDIYFGHTHVPFTDYEYQGIKFHNTGSMIRGLSWRPKKITLLNYQHQTL